MNDRDLQIRWKRGQGSGGQHRNKTENCCVLTHTPTGITVTVDGRSRRSNEKQARRIMRDRLCEHALQARQARKRSDRDRKLRDSRRVRTYDYKTHTVKDHRTGKTAPLDDVLNGRLDKIL